MLRQDCRMRCRVYSMIHGRTAQLQQPMLQTKLIFILCSKCTHFLRITRNRFDIVTATQRHDLLFACLREAPTQENLSPSQVQPLTQIWSLGSWAGPLKVYSLSAKACGCGTPCGHGGAQDLFSCGPGIRTSPCDRNSSCFPGLTTS